MKKSWKSLFVVYILPQLIFLLGCFIHYQRGYYYTGLTSVHAQGADDAYISYRYGWNLSNYNIISWNESGYRRTEGYTDSLWMYMSAALSLLGRKDWAYPFGIIQRGLRTWIALSIQRDMSRFDYGSPKSNDPLVLYGQALEVERLTSYCNPLTMVIRNKGSISHL